MGNQAGEKAENGEARAESGTVEATERRKQGSRKGRNRRPSSWNRKGSGRKEAEGLRKMLKAKAEGKHLWNGCGSEAGKGERKRTAKPSTRTWKERMGNQPGEKGERGKAKAEPKHRESSCEAEPGREGKEKQRLSSQNPKLKRPKGSENSGGQKVDWIAAQGRVKVRPREARKRKPEGKGEPEEAAAEIEAGGRRKEIADEAIR